MNGGMVVLGNVTGNHLIEDIRVSVPYQVAVTLTAEEVLRSRDLWIALQQRFIVKLRDFRQAPNSPRPDNSASAVPSVDLVRLQEENRRLQAQLNESSQRTTGLEHKLDAILVALERLPTVVPRGGPPSMKRALNEAVGGDTPMFLPEFGSGLESEASIRVNTQHEETGRVQEAAALLRKMRQQEK
jgi:hypothetical protein